MELNLIRTEYNFDCLNNKIKAILSYQKGKATIDLFINGELAYYYIIEDFKELVLPDSELVHLASTKLIEDRHRWIKDCTIIEDHLKEFKLIDKVSVYNAEFEKYTFQLKLSTVDCGEKYAFRLEYSNNINRDILNCYVEALNYDELIRKSFIYAQTITDISNTFIDNQEALMSNAFSKFYKK